MGRLRVVGVALALVLAGCTSGDSDAGSSQLTSDAPSDEVPSSEPDAQPQRDPSWTELPTAPLSGRLGHVGVWTGDELVVWGGERSGRTLDDGAAYDLETRAWRNLSRSPLVGRTNSIGVWTGSQLLIWGGETLDAGSGERRLISDGAAYDPEADEWRAMAAFPLQPRRHASVVWTGQDLIVWGGQSGDVENSNEYADGARYDPGSGTWEVMAAGPLAPRFHAPSVWTGEQILIWNGGVLDSDFEGEGWFSRTTHDAAAYDPETDSWEVVDLPSEVESELVAPEVVTAWTEGVVIGWTGYTDAVEFDTPYAYGYRWQPAAGAIEPLAAPPARDARELAAFPNLHVRFDTAPHAIAPGRIFTWGGSIGEGGNHSWNLGFTYDLDRDAWERLPPAAAPGRSGNTTTWTGSQLLIWGGVQDGFPDDYGTEAAWPNDGLVWTPTT